MIAGVSRKTWERFIVKPKCSSDNPSSRGATVTFGAEKKSEKQRKMNTILKKLLNKISHTRRHTRRHARRLRAGLPVLFARMSI